MAFSRTSALNTREAILRIDWRSLNSSTSQLLQTLVCKKIYTETHPRDLPKQIDPHNFLQKLLKRSDSFWQLKYNNWMRGVMSIPKITLKFLRPSICQLFFSATARLFWSQMSKPHVKSGVVSSTCGDFPFTKDRATWTLQSEIHKQNIV